MTTAILSDPAATLGEFLTPADRILATSDGSERAVLDDLLRQSAPDADRESAVYWRATVSTGVLDAYYTRMTRTSLKNYAADADWQNRGGIPFMNAHRTGGLFAGSAELPLGRSLQGRYHDGRGGSEIRTTVDFYTVRGLKLGEVSTDDFIRGLESGVIKDVSIGFRAGSTICSICGEDVLRSEKCPHWPGRTYEIETKVNGKTRKERVLCTADVEDAHLTEVSAVYRGATPGAVVSKLFRAADSGTLGHREARLLEQSYRLAPGTVPVKPNWSGMTINVNGAAHAVGDEFAAAIARGVERAMDETHRTETEAEETPDPGDPTTESRTTPTPPDQQTPQTPQHSLLFEEVRRILTQGVGQENLVAPEQVVTSLRGLIGERDALRTERDTLRTQAADVESYRAAAIKRALFQGERALGKSFRREVWERMLAQQPMADILQITEDWESAAAKTFQSGREATADDATDAKIPRKQPKSRESDSGALPPRAYLT